MKMIGAIILFIGASLNSLADSSQPQTIKQKNSECLVKVSGGEYPKYKVLKKKKIIYAPSSDGVENAKISLDGKFIALGAGEVDLIEGFGVMIINCETEKRKGFLQGKPTFNIKWELNKLVVDGSEISFSGKDSESLPF